MKQYRLIYLLIIFVSGYYAQDPTTISPVDWNGDPNLCTVNADLITDDRPLPRFPSQAEFAMESVEIKHLFNITLPSELTMYQYLYDYDANKLIMIRNKNGFIDSEYYYYEILKKSTYYIGKYCVVTDIPRNNDMDGASAIQLSSGQWHIRPLNEFLLFSNMDPQRPIIRPIYKGQDIVRGIPVDKWESCTIDRAQYRTVRRLWSLAQKNVTLPNGIVGENAVPVQSLISASYDFPNGTQIAEVDEIYNIYSYRPGIRENNDQLAPPKGVFCNSGPDQSLTSLQDVGIQWPDRFSVRVQASSSRSSQWQRFHLRHAGDRISGSRLIHYDYSPVGSEHLLSVIHDYDDNLTYIIDRRLGSCKIHRGTELPDVSPIHDPIGFFIKNQHRFMFDSSNRVWQFNGIRSCRGDSIKCTALTTSIAKFPALVDLDTGKTWEVTTMEYGWSIRAPFSRPLLNETKYFDYPVYLFLRLYQFADPSNPSPSNIRTEDIEYQFYEMSHDLEPSDFDTSICYRSLDLPYFHLGFVLQPSNNTFIDSKYLDRRVLERVVRSTLMDGLQVSGKRVSLLELDYIRFDNSVYVLFTLLGPVPLSNNEEPSIETAQQRLEMTINAGRFTFNTTLLNDGKSTVVFRAQPNSLKVSKQFMSIHASWVYANISNCNVSNAKISNTNFTNTNASDCLVFNVNNSQTHVPRIKQEKYTAAAQASSIIGGLILGMVLGVIALVLVKFLNKKSTSAASSIIPGSLSNMSFHKKRPMPPLSMQNLQAADESDH